MNRWCPSCGKAWPAERPACPDCLVELVDDPLATTVCRHCGRRWPARMQSCPACLAELNPDPAAVAEALGSLLAAGAHVYRPEGTPAFAEGPSCTLRRLAGRGSLVLLGPSGFVEADISGPDWRAALPLTARNPDGSVLFRLRRYEAADDATVALGDDGAPLGTYLRAGQGLDVRDGTSAPVAALRRVPGGFELVETGRGAVATCAVSDVDVDGWVDDHWELQVRAGVALPLAPLAAVAMVVAAKVTFGRPFPAPAGEWIPPPDQD
jgi:hypothetical protein